MRIYNEPEFKAVVMSNEDVLTVSTLPTLSSEWEAGGSGTNNSDESVVGILLI